MTLLRDPESECPGCGYMLRSQHLVHEPGKVFLKCGRCGATVDEADWRATQEKLRANAERM